MQLTSSAFKQNQPIPDTHAGEGAPVSPPLSWQDVPEGTRSLALVMDDPDAPGEDPFVHWIVYRIPPTVNAIPAGHAGGGVEGRNATGRTGYVGPRPPEGDGVHHYRFRLFALDIDPDVDPGRDRAVLADILEGHVLAEAELVGTYEG